MPLLRAASVVRTLAKVADFMPKNPARSDRNAPVTKAPADTLPRPPNNANSAPDTTTA